MPIRRTAHCFHVIPANDTKESVFGHQIFPRAPRGSNPEPLAPAASAFTTELPRLSPRWVVTRSSHTYFGQLICSNLRNWSTRLQVRSSLYWSASLCRSAGTNSADDDQDWRQVEPLIAFFLFLHFFFLRNSQYPGSSSILLIKFNNYCS